MPLLLRWSQKPTWKIPDTHQHYYYYCCYRFSYCSHRRKGDWLGAICSPQSRCSYTSPLCCVPAAHTPHYYFFQVVLGTEVKLEGSTIPYHLSLPPLLKSQVLCLILSILPLPEGPLRYNQKSNKGFSQFFTCSSSP